MEFGNVRLWCCTLHAEPSVIHTTSSRSSRLDTCISGQLLAAGELRLLLNPTLDFRYKTKLFPRSYEGSPP